MILVLSPELEKYFSKDARGFDQLMKLSGDVYRSLEGRRTQRITLQNKNYFIKQHNGVGWKEIFKNIFQGRLPVLSAKNEWKAVSRLHSLGIDTMKIVGFGCRGNNPAALQSFIMTEELAKTVSLEDFCKTWPKRPPPFRVKLKLIQAVASIAKKLHENGINHRDFYICHFLLSLSDETFDSVKLFLIDLHRAQIRGKIPFRWQIKDLAGLYFSSMGIGLTQRDQFRFMKAYHHQPLSHVFNKQRKLWKKVKQRGEELASWTGK